MKIMSLNKYLPTPSLLFFVVVAVVVYWPGLIGDFLFDDFPNLESIGQYGQVDSWETAKAFITSGFAGPTGRPISLASFLLDDNTWPSYAPWFKLTNLYIHLLCGLLLCWATLLLIRNLKTVTEQQAQWVAVLTCAFWLLHPYMVSTTLYVVQRMAQLATLFSLLGIVIYLHARLQLKDKPIKAYLLMMFGIGLGTILATFSKENGALLPLLILVIEFCLPKDDGKPALPWRVVFLWLPAIAIALFMARYINFSETPWPNRNFNQIERLLTEGRIVSEYLLHLFVPRIEGNGLYQDGYIISKSLINPISTLYALLFLFSLFISAFLVRKKAPVISLAILFFFAAHLMESTVVGLELYFEHRNYLAALFLFLPIGYYGTLYSKQNKVVAIGLALLVIMLAALTYARAELWSDSKTLEQYWAQSAVDSPRANNSIITALVGQGKHLEALQFAQSSSARLSDSSFLTIRVLMLKASMQLATEKDFINTAQRLKQQSFDTQTIMGVRVLAEYIIQHEQRNYAGYMLNFINEIETNKRYNRSSVFKRLTPYLKANLYLLLGQIDESVEFYQQALQRYKRTSSSLKMVSELAIAGYPHQALQLLDRAEVIFNNEPDKSLDRSRESYASEFTYLRQQLHQDISESKPSI